MWNIFRFKHVNINIYIKGWSWPNTRFQYHWFFPIARSNGREHHEKVVMLKCCNKKWKQPICPPHLPTFGHILDAYTYIYIYLYVVYSMHLLGFYYRMKINK